MKATFLRKLPVLAVALSATLSGAQTVPGVIDHQGRLTDNTPQQNPVNATVSMQFAIWDAATAGTRLWREPNVDGSGVSIVVTNGYFGYLLGSTVPIPASVFQGATSTRYLEIILNPGGTAETLTPRQRLAAAPYANLAERANASGNADTVTNGVYTTGGYANPAWITSLAGGKISGSVSSATTAGSFTGSLAGDVTGTQGATTVARLRGVTVSATAPTASQVLQYVGAQWQPSTLSAVETDPEVAMATSGRVPRWNGSALADGSLLDDGAGKVGLGTATPAARLDVASTIPTAIASGATTASSALAVDGRYVYTVGTTGRFEVWDASDPSALAMVGSLTSSTFANSTSIDVSGRYAAVATADGLVVLDVSDAANPAVVAGTAVPNTPAHVRMRGGIIHLSDFTAGGVLMVRPDLTYVGMILGLTGPAGVALDGGHAYVANFTGNRLSIHDVRNPQSPVNRGSSTDGLNGPVDVDVEGRYAYVASQGNDAVAVFDVSNANSPVRIGSITSAGLTAPVDVEVEGSRLYVLYQTAGKLAVYQLSAPATATLIGSANVTSPDHFAVSGRYGFVVTGSDLQTFDLGGARISRLEAGGIETGRVSTRDLRVTGDVAVRGGIEAGSGGIGTSGSFRGDGAGLTNLQLSALPTSGNWNIASDLSFGGNTFDIDPNNDRVGVGTATPAFALDVVSATGNTHARFGANFPLFIESAWPVIGFNAYYNGGNIYGSSGFAGNFTMNPGTGTFELQTAPSGTAGTGATMTTRLSVSQTGLVGIGRYPGTNRLEVEGEASKTTAGGWLANSDARIKTGIRSLDGALGTIGRLRPVAFRYGDDWRAKHPSIGDHDYYNFVAQEYREVFPECVTEDADGILMIDPHAAFVTAVRAIQELDAENRDLRERLSRLEAIVERLSGAAPERD